MSSSPKPQAGSGTGSAGVNGNDDTQKAKRARTSRPKVKTGCTNCKQRRIKCDEKRPSCMNCVRSKKICTGYPPPTRREIMSNIRIAPKPPVIESTPPPGRKPIVLPPRRVPRKTQTQKRLVSPPPTPVTPVTPVEERAVPVMTMDSPSMNLPFSEQEGLYFQLSQEHAAAELSGFFDSMFWSSCYTAATHFPSNEHACPITQQPLSQHVWPEPQQWFLPPK